ncbi:hymenoptaecin-1 isoform 1 precursor [Nasonia vitripennis]|uniref:Nahymenoptaecin-1 n=1 Tax=Nasonia vitripennis TaxID=7425 RepID=D4P8J0_NASVI|nr:hymenoptaecin-1 isoform 1 precursor [Nasonia vitripennis]ADD84773.1 nahymenoptaecin-1 precursor [Nasonia vitripennis]
MKLSIAVVSLFCIVACAHATFAPTRPGQPSFPYPGTRGGWPPRSTGPTFPRPPQQPINHRFRREASPTFAPTRPGQPSFPYPGTGGGWPPRSTGPTFPRPPQQPFNHRFRREARPQQNSISLEGVKPLSGPNRQPSLDLNYNHRIFEDHRGNLDAYGGANWAPGRLSPHAGLKFERNYGNGFIGGHGQVQPGPGGRMDPSIGIHGGFRF